MVMIRFGRDPKAIINIKRTAVPAKKEWVINSSRAFAFSSADPVIS